MITGADFQADSASAVPISGPRSIKILGGPHANLKRSVAGQCLHC
jgi:hypothetical protein